MTPADIRACSNEYGMRIDAQDEHDHTANAAETAIWRTLAQSPEDAGEWIDANQRDYCDAEETFAKIAHFIGFMRVHGPFDAAALAAIGARAVAEVSAIVDYAAEAV